jgi:signal recognition particle receptor subunit alpha
MIDLFCIFTTGGLILWSKSFVSFDFSEILNDLIKTILMDEKKTQDFYIPVKGNGIILRWKIFNKSGIIFVVAYQQSFNVLYTDKLLDIVMNDFIKDSLPSLNHENNIFFKLPDEKEYTQKFITLLKGWENYCKNKVSNKKEEKTKEENNLNLKGSNNFLSKSENNLTNPNSSFQSPSLVPGIGGSQNFHLRRKKQDFNNSASKKNGNKKNNGKNKKESRVWNEVTKVDKKSMEILDQSDKKEITDLSKNKSQEYFNSQVFGEGGPEVLDDGDFYEMQENENKPKGIFGKFTSALKNYIGNKVLTKEDLKPVMDELVNLLLEKNVAKEIAENLCESVKKSLLNTKTNSFTTIQTTVKDALKDSIAKILTPKEELDILRNALAAKKRGEPYKIVFIGVNGVGKSTNLAKVGYMLMNNGLKISIAACDNFRSGAIEQLKTHANALKCHLFEKGYKDDPAYIAKEAIEEAKKEGYDCVLIDTAGRMQDNEPLMKSLAKLVDINQPDAILFVGEALTGNDSVDQLTKFNQALIDNSKKDNPRTIDGILLTKFDTVDDKVGSALTMVYTTGKPIVYVGTGQKYINLKKLNVNNVLNALFG